MRDDYSSDNVEGGAGEIGMAQLKRRAAKSSSDLIELWTTHTRRQIAVLNEQIKELTALGQKMAGESAEPITRIVSQAFKKAS